MVIRGSSRGNGRQLGDYLLKQDENENIEILGVSGKDNPRENDLRYKLVEMSLLSELSKSDKGLYHAQINPAYGEDKTMTPEQWEMAADILAQKLNLEKQDRVIVLHTKNDRTHAHVVFSRYDREQGKIISDSFSRLKQNEARQTMEQVFGHERTKERNRPQDMKRTLSDIWHKSKDGQEFVKSAKAAGYTITDGYKIEGGRERPFGVVDKDGRSFDLMRQLIDQEARGKAKESHVKTKDARERLAGVQLPKEKEAQRAAKSQHQAQDMNRAQEQAQDKKDRHRQRQEAGQEQQKFTRAQAFKETGDTIQETDRERLAKDYAANKGQATAADDQARSKEQRQAQGKYYEDLQDFFAGQGENMTDDKREKQRPADLKDWRIEPKPQPGPQEPPLSRRDAKRAAMVDKLKGAIARDQERRQQEAAEKHRATEEARKQRIANQQAAGAKKAQEEEEAIKRQHQERIEEEARLQREAAAAEQAQQQAQAEAERREKEDKETIEEKRRREFREDLARIKARQQQRSQEKGGFEQELEL